MKVVLLSGFLGSGKTTLLKHILTNKDNKKVGVIVNDMAELNIDASLVNNSKLVQQEEKLVQLQNGCVCCTLREDLYKTLKMFKDDYKFEYVIVESTGISEPLNVAETFYIDYEDKHLHEMGIMIDQCITVLDTTQVFQHLGSNSQISEDELNLSEEDEGTIANLFVNQIEFANTIILNKIDLLPTDPIALKAKRSQLYHLMQSLNPKARIIEATHSKISMDQVFDTQLFDIDEAESYAGWLNILINGKLNRNAEKLYLKSEIDEYDISSFIYARRRPFDPFKLDKFFDTEYIETLKESGIVRSKGFFWVAHHPDFIYHWEQAGASLNISVDSKFYAALEEEEWLQVPEEGRKNILKDYVKPHGDRRQELVFIGLPQMEQKTIEAHLDACLLDDKQWAAVSAVGYEKWEETLYPGMDDIPFAVEESEMMDASPDDEQEVVKASLGSSTHEHKHEHKH